ncbi:flagellar export chaperone FlgN [Vibrio sp. E150_011]
MTVTKSELVQNFVVSISDDIRLYHKLLALLQHQKALYLKLDGNALNKNIEQQLPVLKQLSRGAATRTMCLQQLQLPSSEIGVKALTKALPIKLQAHVVKQWSVLEALIKQCQRCNHDNGQSSAAFHELLGELTGKAPNTYEEQAVYGEYAR